MVVRHMEERPNGLSNVHGLNNHGIDSSGEGALVEDSKIPTGLTRYEIYIQQQGEG